MDFKKINPGTPLKKMPSMNAAWQNAVSRSTQHFIETVEQGDAKNNSTGLDLPTDLVKCKNTTETAFARGHCIQLASYSFTAVKFRSLWFNGEVYDGSKPWGIVREHMKPTGAGNNGYGKVQMAGVSTAVVNVTDTAHRFAEPESGSRVFKSAASGPLEILHEPAETGEQECAVKFDGGNSNATNFAVTVDALPPGSETGTGSTYVRTLGTAGDVYVLVRDGATLKVPEDAEPIEAVSGYKDREIPANMLVRLDYAGSPPIATLVEEMDYLRTAENYDPDAVIQTFHQKEDVLHAGGGTCAPTE